MWALLVATALGAECETMGMADVMAITPPAIVVLGERHGMQPDLGRATRIVRRLADRAPVTVALEAVGGDQQSVLDRYGRGDLATEDLSDALVWDTTWGFPFAPYEPLLETAATHGTRLVAAGLPLGTPPQGAEFPVPGGYMSILRDAMGEREIPLPAQSDFLRTVAWRDFRMAQQALAGWDEQGYLVIVADRLHVEGGKGLPWQAKLMTRVPVHAFLLAWSIDPPCYAGDQSFAPGLSEKLAGASKPPR
jgi:hypothetical protein